MFALVSLLALALLPFSLLGAFVAFHIVRLQRPPADASNRINAIRLLWFALTREELFVPLFPWLRRDEAENVGEKP